MTLLTRLILLSLLLTAALPLPAQTLSTLQQSYDKAVADKAAGPFQAAVAELNAKYSTALDRLTTAATQAGNLDEAIALRDEKKLLLLDGTLPEDSEITPASLKSARQTYRQQVTALKAARDAATQPLTDHFRTLLQNLLTQTTQAGKLDEALLIREKIASLSATTPDKTPSVVIPSTPATPPTRSAASSKLITAKSTGKTDAAAAQQVIAWALANGATVTTSLGIVGAEEKLKTAPPGKFSVTEINMGPASESFPWHVLAGLGQLDRLYLPYGLKLTEAETQHFRHLGALRTLKIGSVTDAGLQAMSALPTVKELILSQAHEDLSTLPLFQQHTPEVTKLVVTSSEKIGNSADAFFAALTAWQEVGEVHSFVSIKAAQAQHLARLPKLRRLLLFSGSTIEVGCLPLIPQLTTVNFNAKQPPEILREVAAKPNLEWFTFDMEGLTFADLPDLSGCPKLLKLEIENPPSPASEIIAKYSFPQGLYVLKLYNTEIDEVAIERLLKFKRLDILQLVQCRFTPTAIAMLKEVKQPKEIDLRASNLTDAEFKALQKALPKCKIHK